jgi:hypothetical protein
MDPFDNLIFSIAFIPDLCLICVLRRPDLAARFARVASLRSLALLPQKITKRDCSRRVE